MGAKKAMGASVISHDDAPPVLELCEHIFNDRTFFVEHRVIGDLNFSIFFKKIQGFISFSIIPFLNQFASYPRSANRTLVRGKDLGAWQGMQNGPRAQKIAALPFREPQDERTAFCIANGVER